MALINQFNALSLNDINNYITSQQEENLNLDFKLVNGANLGGNEDRKNLAKALSGFANSSGGLIVWGVDARKNASGIDCAIGTQEIDPLSLLISRLNELTGRGVNPIVEGVLHKSIPTTGDKGFAVTLVPESDSGPHMAKLGEDRYYKRSGDSFYRMEHFDLEDMFGRRKKPLLQLTYSIENVDRIVLGIENIGRGVAKSPYLSFIVPEPYILSEFGVDGNRGWALPVLKHAGRSRTCKFGGGGMITIHPGMVLDVAILWFGIGRPNVPNVPSEIKIKYEIAAEDYPLKQSEVSVKL
jgi:hypothetical protein